MMKYTSQKTVQQTYCVCDFCDNNCERQCPGCNRDVCRKCGIWWEIDPWTGDSNGDYWPLACKRCNDKLNVYVNKARFIQEKADRSIEILREKWFTKCAKTIRCRDDRERK